MMAIYGNPYLLPNRHCYLTLSTPSQELLGARLLPLLELCLKVIFSIRHRFLKPVWPVSKTISLPCWDLWPQGGVLLFLVIPAALAYHSGDLPFLSFPQKRASIDFLAIGSLRPVDACPSQAWQCVVIRSYPCLAIANRKHGFVDSPIFALKINYCRVFSKLLWPNPYPPLRKSA